MKQIKIAIFVLCMVSWSFSAVAQTNFRHLTIDEAVKVAEKENKLIFVDFYTDWCGPCKRMANEIFPKKEVGDYMNKHFVCVKLNAEKEGKDAAKFYKVTAYPTFLVLDTQKKVLLDMKGAMSGENLIFKLSNQLNPDMTPERMKQRYAEGERTPELINSYVYFYLENKDEETGFRILNDYFDSLSDKERKSAENFFIFGRYTLDLADAKAQFLVKNCKKFDPAVREEAITRAEMLYRNAFIPYLSGYMFVERKFDQEAYNKLKNELIELGFDKTYPYGPLFELVECYRQKDYVRYVEMLKEKRPEMNVQDFDLILLNIYRLLPLDKDKQLASMVSKYVRSVLPELRPNTISLMGRLLGALEGH